MVRVGGRPRAHAAGPAARPALRGRDLPAVLRAAGHPLLAPRLVHRGRRAAARRRPAGRHPGRPDPRPPRRQLAARRALAAGRGVAGAASPSSSTRRATVGGPGMLEAVVAATDRFAAAQRAG